MPYTAEQLTEDARFKGLPNGALNLFVAALNAAEEKHKDDESACFAAAWTAVKEKFEKTEAGPWSAKPSELDAAASSAMDGVEQFVALSQSTPFNVAGAVGVQSPTDASAFTVTREAKIFEAGNYPDKDIDVSESDLDAIIANYTPVPLKIEHGDSVFDGALGTLAKLWRSGKELLGSLAFTDEAWALVEKAGIKSLSAGIKRDKSGIAEVSLVRSPRIADARVFSDDLVGFSAALDWNTSAQVGETMANTHREVDTLPTETNDTAKMGVQDALQAIQSLRPDSPEAQAIYDAAKQLVNFKAQADEDLIKTGQAARAAVDALQQANMESLVMKFKQQGKVVPAVESIARAIIARKPLAGASFSADETVTFKDGDTDRPVHFAELFIAFLEASPPCVNFRELGAQGEVDALSTEGRQLFKAFGVDPESPTAKQVIAEMRR